MKTFHKILISIILSILSASSYSSVVPSKVISVTSTAPSLTDVGYKLGTIERGFAANDPYRQSTHTVPKKTLGGFIKNNIKSIAKLRYGAVGLALIAADYVIENCPNGLSVCLIPDQKMGYCSIASSSMQPSYPASVCTGYVQQYYHEQYMESERTSQANVTVTQAELSSGNLELTVVIDYYFATAYGQNGWENYQWLTDTKTEYFNVTGLEPDPDNATEPSDEELATALNPHIQAQQFPVSDYFTDAAGNPYSDLFEGATYNPTANQTDLDLAKAYNQGLTQSTDPNADYYIDPAKLPEIQQLALTLQQASPENDADSLNQSSGLDIEQPITQAQYEASNAASMQELTGSLSELDFSGVQDAFDDFDNEVNEINNEELPYELPSVFKWDYPVGNCVGFTLSTAAVTGNDIVADAHCPPYDRWVEPLLNWSLGLITLLHLFHIFRITIEKGVIA